MPPLPSNSPHCTGPSQDLHMHFCHDLSTPDPPCSSHPNCSIILCWARSTCFHASNASRIKHVVACQTRRRTSNTSPHVKHVVTHQKRHRASNMSPRVKRVIASRIKHIISPINAVPRSAGSAQYHLHLDTLHVDLLFGKMCTAPHPRPIPHPCPMCDTSHPHPMRDGLCSRPLPLSQWFNNIA